MYVPHYPITGLNVNISHRHERPRCRSSLLRRSRLRRSGALAWPGGAVRTYDNLDKPIDLNRSEDTCTVTSIRLGDGPVLECVVGGALERSAPCAPPERVWPHRSRNRASQGPSVARPGRALPRPGPDFHPTRPRVRPRPAVSQSLMPPMRRGRSGRSIHVDCVCRRLRLLSVVCYHLWCPCDCPC